MSKVIGENAAYAVWNIQETFLELPYLSPETFPAELNPVRQAEWIIGRVLAKKLCDMFNIPYEGTGRNDHKKPYLKNMQAHISISHSFPIAAAMIHLKKPCGIDMEQPRAKHRIVAHKYLHESELQYINDLRALCVVWSAKEVVYKIFGRKFLSLKDEIKITFGPNGTIMGQILKAGCEETHHIHYEWVKDYLLAYGA